jgi:Tol biopolymer transport system component
MSSIAPTFLRSIAVSLLLVSGSVAFASNDTDKPEVILFAPGRIPTSALRSLAPAFTPDGASVYLGQQSIASKSICIMSSQRKGTDWSAPQPVSFSSQNGDLEPAFSPDGKYLIFASGRPTTPSGTALEGRYNGQVLPGRGGNLWRVTRTKNGWGSPEVLPPVINTNSSIFSPAITADGSLYFMRADNGINFYIYRSQKKNGQYEAPVRVSFGGDTTHSDYDPAVAPDESFIIFSSGRPPAPKTTDLFIAFRTANGWGDPIDLRSALSDLVYGVEARLSPDSKTLYFTNSRSASGATSPDGQFIWQVDISSLLRAHGLDKASGTYVKP